MGTAGACLFIDGRRFWVLSRVVSCAHHEVDSTVTAVSVLKSAIFQGPEPRILIPHEILGFQCAVCTVACVE